MDQRRFVYVLESIADPLRHYVGLASDVAARLDQHNAGKAVHTLKHRPWRLPAAIEFYRALKLLKVPTVLVRVPGEGHGINGSISHRVATVLYLTAWFDKYIRRNDGTR